jgi:hypothetical protein
MCVVTWHDSTWRGWEYGDPPHPLTGSWGGNFLILTFAYTTSDVYLTLRFEIMKFMYQIFVKLLLPMALSKQCVIYLSNIRGIVTYHWPKDI